MTNSENLIAELEYELVSTGKLLNLLPAANLGWKPHAKAMSLAQLANHVAVIPVRYLTFAEDGFTDIAVLTTHHVPKDKEEILDRFETGSQEAKTLLKNADDKWLQKNWSLTRNGAAIFTIPVLLFVRLLVLNHLYHHRGQLATYLRTLEVLVPSIYGPSADEDPFV